VGALEQIDWIDSLSESEVQRWQRLYDDGTYPEDFWQWIELNAHVLTAFIALARRSQARGLRRWSSDAICHVLRWQTAMREAGQSHLKINDHATAGLARLAMQLAPDLIGFFATRTPPARHEARRLIDGRLYSEPRDETAEAQ